MLANLSKCLNLTPQQCEIVNIIYNLQERKIPSTPIAIEKEYINEKRIFLQKSNLFSQLKILLDKKIITKDNRAHYTINVEGIKEAIYVRKKELDDENKIITSFVSDTESFFEKMIKPTQIFVTYLSETELYSKLSFYLKQARAYYLGCDFPHYSYSFVLCKSAAETSYVETLNVKLHDTKFALYCLSAYKTDILISKLYKKYNNEQLIKEEIKSVCENSKTKTIQHKNIDLRKTITPLDFAIIECDDGVGYLFMFLKGSNSDVNGGIFIRSYETTKQIKQYFLSQMSINQPLSAEKDFPEMSELFLLQSNSKKKKLIVFDVNRVFTMDHTTTELAKLVGKEDKAKDIINQQIEGTLNVHDAIAESAKLLKGLKVDDIKTFLPKLSLMKNVREGLDKLKKNGYLIVAISTGFSHIVAPLCSSLGIDEFYCNVLEEKNGKLTGNALEKNIVLDNVKYYISKYLMEKYSIPEENTVGVGDGYSDLDLLKAAKVRIAFNPSKRMIELYKEKSPLINHLIKEKDFGVLVETILKVS